MLILTPACQFLREIDGDWRRLVDAMGPCALAAPVSANVSADERQPWQALARAVAGQQVHGKAAEAIFGRFLAHYHQQDGGVIYPTAEQVLATEPDTLRTCGLSAAKTRAIIALAHGAVSGEVPTLAQAKSLSDEVLTEQLTALPGIGPWTVQMFLMHTLRRPDVMPVADFGVREGWRLLKGLERQPTPKALLLEAQAWRPYRSAAAWYLWRAVDRVKQAR
ncbi:MAG: DNA-3-methyladenine glycosylase [Paraperlucidibaca sp.]